MTGLALLFAAVTVPWATTSTEPLEARFKPPAGFARVPAAPGSFAAFLRGLPLAPAGAPVLDFAGRKLYEEGRHPNIAAVVDLDVGGRDLQQCADAIVRLDAEWRYARGERDLVYRAVSGQRLSYARYRAGARAVPTSAGLTFPKVAPARPDDHPLFRAWLDEVFAWVGTASLARDGEPVAQAALRGGDALVQTGQPFGHAVLVLDVARDASGRTAVLLGQSYMPAQSFHVLQSREGSAWFTIGAADETLATPFWRPFPLTSLRRLGPVL